MTNKLTEDSFLDSRIQRAIQVYLISGIKLVGVLHGHHADVVFLLPRGGRADDVQMISKCAISTISLASPSTRPAATDDLESTLRLPRCDWRRET